MPEFIVCFRISALLGAPSMFQTRNDNWGAKSELWWRRVMISLHKVANVIIVKSAIGRCALSCSRVIFCDNFLGYSLWIAKRTALQSKLCISDTISCTVIRCSSKSAFQHDRCSHSWQLSAWYERVAHYKLFMVFRKPVATNYNTLVHDRSFLPYCGLRLCGISPPFIPSFTRNVTTKSCSTLAVTRSDILYCL
jgi:hypothetical protein